MQPEAVNELVRQVLIRPDETWRGTNPAVGDLASLGAAGVAAVLTAMSGPFPPEVVSRDGIELLATVLHETAKRDPFPLIEVLDRELFPADPHLVFVVSALGTSRTEASREALKRALRHRNLFVRWMAASGLARSPAKVAKPEMVVALRDRSPDVKFEAVEALRKRKALRSPEALEPLRRIVRSPSLQKHSPGLWRNARDLLAEMES